VDPRSPQSAAGRRVGATGRDRSQAGAPDPAGGQGERRSWRGVRAVRRPRTPGAGRGARGAPPTGRARARRPPEQVRWGHRPYGPGAGPSTLAGWWLKKGSD